MTAPGIDFDRHSALTRRALDVIGRAPVSTQELAREVFGIRSSPEGLASRLVFDLLGSDRRVRVNAQGVWSRASAASVPEDRPLEEIDFAVVDVETTGGSPARGDRIVEFACVQLRGGRVIGEFESLVNPGMRIPRWISGLTGIDDSLVEPAPRFAQIADTVRAALDGRVFVAHNVSFDWRFVAEELRRARSEIPVGDRLCTVKLARRALPGLRRRGLDSLARYFGIEIEGRHRAAGDARATAIVLNRLLEAVGKVGVTTWSELDAWLGGRAPGRRDRAEPRGRR